MNKGAKIEERDGYAVIHIPVEEVQSLRVALAPCSCRANKSNNTTAIRDRLNRALGRIRSSGKRT